MPKCAICLENIAIGARKLPANDATVTCDNCGREVCDDHSNSVRTDGDGVVTPPEYDDVCVDCSDPDSFEME